jgi:hypothetical protein
MTAQKPNESDGANGGIRKFPEPKAWALDWDFEAPVNTSAASAGGLESGQESDPAYGKWDKFPQPKGWSLEWDGSSMDAIQEFYNRKTDAGSTGRSSDAA